MSGSEPPHDPAVAEDAEEPDPAPRTARTGRRLAVVVLVALLALLVWSPWRSAGPAPLPVSPTTSDAPTSPPPVPPPSATASPPAVPPPGADAVFDPATAGLLFATAADVQRAVPGADSRIERVRSAGPEAWGLPAGTTVEPAACTVAVTTVPEPPVHHDTTSWVADDLTVEQDVVVLLDAAAARAAFRALVTTVDGCPRYGLVAPEGDGPTWTADPALEGQGLFPAIVHDVTARVEGDTFHQTSGYVLVGNAILSWSATALTAEDREAATAVLGTPAELSAMVEKRALAAVRAVSRSAPA